MMGISLYVYKLFITVIITVPALTHFPEAALHIFRTPFYENTYGGLLLIFKKVLVWNDSEFPLDPLKFL